MDYLLGEVVERIAARGAERLLPQLVQPAVEAWPLVGVDEVAAVPQAAGEGPCVPWFCELDRPAVAER